MAAIRRALSPISPILQPVGRFLPGMTYDPADHLMAHLELARCARRRKHEHQVVRPSARPASVRVGHQSFRRGEAADMDARRLSTRSSSLSLLANQAVCMSSSMRLDQRVSKSSRSRPTLRMRSL